MRNKKYKIYHNSLILRRHGYVGNYFILACWIWKKINIYNLVKQSGKIKLNWRLSIHSRKNFIFLFGNIISLCFTWRRLLTNVIAMLESYRKEEIWKFSEILRILQCSPIVLHKILGTKRNIQAKLDWSSKLW